MSAALVTASQNPEIVRAAADVVKSTQSNAMKVLKVVGITIGAGLATFFVVRLVKKAKEKKEQSQKVETYAEVDGKKLSKEELTEKKKLKDSEIESIADSLKVAFDLNAKYEWTQNYDEKRIKRELSKLQNEYDWAALVTVFDKKHQKWDDKYHNLVELLHQDDGDDVLEYQKILSEKHIPVVL